MSAENWSITLEQQDDLHSIPVGCIRDADGDLLAIQHYPEWDEHRRAFALMRAAPELEAKAKALEAALDKARHLRYWLDVAAGTLRAEEPTDKWTLGKRIFCEKSEEAMKAYDAAIRSVWELAP